MILRITVLHGLTRREARRRIERLPEKLLTEYGDRIGEREEGWWQSDTYRFRFELIHDAYPDGIVVAGFVRLGESSVELQFDIPFLAWLLRGAAIRRKIEERAHEVLGGPP